MWPAFARTRRRLMQAFDPSLPTGVASIAAHPTSCTKSAPVGPPDGPAPEPDVVLTMGRVDLERLVTALQALLGPDVARPDTPNRLEVALAAAVQLLGGGGRPRVTRRPPGFYTPEAWQVRITSVDPAIGEAIRNAARGSGFNQ